MAGPLKALKSLVRIELVPRTLSVEDGEELRAVESCSFRCLPKHKSIMLFATPPHHTQDKSTPRHNHCILK